MFLQKKIRAIKNVAKFDKIGHCFNTMPLSVTTGGFFMGEFMKKPTKPTMPKPKGGKGKGC